MKGAEPNRTDPTTTTTTTIISNIGPTRWLISERNTRKTGRRPCDHFKAFHHHQRLSDCGSHVSIDASALTHRLTCLLTPRKTGTSEKPVSSQHVADVNGNSKDCLLYTTHVTVATATAAAAAARSLIYINIRYKYIYLLLYPSISIHIGSQSSHGRESRQ